MATLQWQWHDPNCKRRDCQREHKYERGVQSPWSGEGLYVEPGVYRDPARLGTWDGDTFYPDNAYARGEEESMKHYDDARYVLGAQVHDLLENFDGTKRVWYNVDREGPMGGMSTQVSGYIELEDGTIAPFAINIYSDHNIERAVQAKLDEEERQRELRERLDS